MVEVYRVLWDADKVRIARSEGKEVVLIEFSEFEAILGHDDFIVSTQTVKKKWKMAIEDGVISPFSRTYGRSAVMIETLAAKLHEKYVCVKRVCVSEDLNTTSKGAF